MDFSNKSREELEKMLEEVYELVEKIKFLSQEKDKVIDELLKQCNSLYNENQILKLKNI
jgi:hypothetical protein